MQKLAGGAPSSPSCCADSLARSGESAQTRAQVVTPTSCFVSLCRHCRPSCLPHSLPWARRWLGWLPRPTWVGILLAPVLGRCATVILTPPGRLPIQRCAVHHRLCREAELRPWVPSQPRPAAAMDAGLRVTTLSLFPLLTCLLLHGSLQISTEPTTGRIVPGGHSPCIPFLELASPPALGLTLPLQSWPNGDKGSGAHCPPSLSLGF